MTAGRYPTDRGFLNDIAKALHAGRSWEQIAHALNQPPRAFRRFYRPRVRSYVLRLLNDPTDPPHGTLARYSVGNCYPDGRRCEPCTAAKADHLHRIRDEWRGRVVLPTDQTTVTLIAKRIHEGGTWELLATDAGCTAKFFRDTYRPLIQDACLQLARRDDPPQPGEPDHGTRWRCRCEPCTYSGVVYEQQRLKDRRRGQQSYFDATKARAHIAWLRENGIGLKRISEVCGISTGTLTKLVYGAEGRPPSRRIRAVTGRRIMAVTLRDRAAGGRVDAAETWVYVDLLVANGWTKRAIAQRLGQTSGALQLSRRQVSAEHARIIAALARDELIPPPDARRQTRWHTTHAQVRVALETSR